MLNFPSKKFEGEIEIKEHADALQVPPNKSNFTIRWLSRC